MTELSKIPVLRLLIPLCIGILLSIHLNLHFISNYLLLLVFGALSVCFFIQKNSLVQKWTFIFLADIVLLIIGINLTYSKQLINQPNYYGKFAANDTLSIIAQIDDIPVQKQKTVKVVLGVNEIKTKNNFDPRDGNLISYVQNSSIAKDLKPGNVLLIKGRLQAIAEPKNPDQFNFKNYFNDKGIYHSIYVDSNSIKILKAKQEVSLWQIGLKIKYQLISSLRSSGLSNDAYAICAALITGFDDDIDKNTMQSFSHSGTLHVLSVSGLHVGVIYVLLNFIFSLIDPNKRYKVVQLIFVLFCLWFFALITGFSAPVLRSVLMFSLLGIGNLFFRNRTYNQLNILFFSAFLLLFYDPFLIRNIGFLLSYSALFGIIYFYPKIKTWYEPRNLITKHIWESTALSAAATLTTLPITLFVFHQFPIWFALANLVVVPATFVLLILAFVALVKLSFITWITNQLTFLLIKFIYLFNSDAYAFIDRIDFDLYDSLFMILVIFLISLTFAKRNYRYVFTLFSVIISWQLFSIFSSYQSKSSSEMVIYHTPKNTSISMKSKTDIVLNKKDSVHYEMQVKPHLTASNYAQIQLHSFNYIKLNKTALLVLDKKKMFPLNLNKFITHVLVTENALPNQAFFDRYQVKMIIADASNSNYTTDKLQAICSKNNVSFYNIKNKGAFVLPIM